MLIKKTKKIEHILEDSASSVQHVIVKKLFLDMIKLHQIDFSTNLCNGALKSIMISKI